MLSRPGSGGGGGGGGGGAGAAAGAAGMRLDLKVILLGDAGVGKTCFVNRFTDSKFTPNSPSTAGASFRYKVCQVDGVQVTLGLWDTAGQARFDNLQSFYCRGARAAMVCYDVADRASFEHVRSWVARVRREAERGCVLAIVGTKSDLAEDGRREVPADEAAALAGESDALFFETSALSGAKVVEVFNEVMTAYVRSWRQRNTPSPAGRAGRADGSAAPLLKGADDSDGAARKDGGGGGGGCCACCAVQ